MEYLTAWIFHMNLNVDIKKCIKKMMITVIRFMMIFMKMV